MSAGATRPARRTHEAPPRRTRGARPRRRFRSRFRRRGRGAPSARPELSKRQFDMYVKVTSVARWHGGASARRPGTRRESDSRRSTPSSNRADCSPGDMSWSLTEKRGSSRAMSRTSLRRSEAGAAAPPGGSILRVGFSRRLRREGGENLRAGAQDPGAQKSVRAVTCGRPRNERANGTARPNCRAGSGRPARGVPLRRSSAVPLRFSDGDRSAAAAVAAAKCQPTENK